jgi:hypothetical protein
MRIVNRFKRSELKLKNKELNNLKDFLIRRSKKRRNLFYYNEDMKNFMMMIRLPKGYNYKVNYMATNDLFFSIE